MTLVDLQEYFGCYKTVSLYVKRYSVYPVYNVRSQLQFTMVGRHYVSNYLYCRIQSRGMLHDAERDLLAIAKFLVHNAINMLRR